MPATSKMARRASRFGRSHRSLQSQSFRFDCNLGCRRLPGKCLPRSWRLRFNRHPIYGHEAEDEIDKVQEKSKCNLE